MTLIEFLNKVQAEASPDAPMMVRIKETGDLFEIKDVEVEVLGDVDDPHYVWIDVVPS